MGDSENDPQTRRDILNLRKQAEDFGIGGGLFDSLVKDAENAGDAATNASTSSSASSTSSSASSTSTSSPSDMERKDLLKIINEKRSELETAMNEYNTLMGQIKTKPPSTQLDELKNKVFKLNNGKIDEYFQINAYGYKRMFEGVDKNGVAVLDKNGKPVLDHSTTKTGSVESYRTLPETCANLTTNEVIDLDDTKNKKFKEKYDKLIKPDTGLIKQSDAKIKSKANGGQCGMESKNIFYNGGAEETFAYITPAGMYRSYPNGTTKEDLKSYSQCGDKVIEDMIFKENITGDRDETKTANKSINDAIKLKYEALKANPGLPLTSKETDSCQEVVEDDDPMVVKRELEEKINTLYDEIKELISKLGEKADEVEKKAAAKSEEKVREMTGNETEIMKLKRELETDKEQASYFEIFKRYLNIRIVILMLVLLGLSTMVFYFLGTGTINFSKYFEKVKTETTDAIEDIREGAEDVVEDAGEAVVDTEKL